MYTGKLIKLREYREADIPHAQTFINDPDIKFNMTPGVPWPLTLKDEQQFIHGITSGQDNYCFAIETLDTGAYIGGCGINWLDWKNSRAMIGIFIGPAEFQGRGYGTDAMHVLISFIFNEMNIRKIKLLVYAFNERAVKCYQKCGFVVEGIKKAEVFKQGAYHDEIEMALFREDWLARKGT